MLKYFKLLISVILLLASSFGAFAQDDIYKDVILDGKPAKLNVKTGKITHIDGTVAKSLAAKKIKDSVKASNTVINKNLLTNDSKFAQTKSGFVKKSDSTNVIYTNRPDTLVNYFKYKKVQVAADSLMNSQTVFVLTNNDSTDDTKTEAENEPNKSQLLKLKQKSTRMVYEVSEPNTYKDNSANFHKVLKGETLYMLSQRYQTSLGELKKANNLESTLITVGQILQVRNFENTDYSRDKNSWTVSKGDTLYNIAKRNNTSVASLKALNGLVSNLIKIGQKLQLK